MSGGDSYHLPCPKCGAHAFQQCRSLTKGCKTDTHTARLALYYDPDRRRSVPDANDEESNRG
jgi:hypothetical protein